MINFYEIPRKLFTRACNIPLYNATVLLHLEQTEVDKLLSKLPTPEVLSGIKISNVEFEKVITVFP